ncbi:SAM-dependent methyltransferase [Burkholderia sp. Ac-20345]|uniref:SAM-dependent methyltransferase n=1 Tax=Burkholderia sp. Ac-20345 TaxID=2703891 RepID=UPI00197C9294|nr:SAM-dependent methyltransferase [Burkholderia sp. Ac-20345]MBN3782480.1 SAM-dependent methyltransferase [Burkholderia sp. Ac-20345]
MSDPKQPVTPAAADFATRDPGNASFWDERFERGVTPWEFGGVPDGFSVFAHRLEPCAVLIPGCGSAQEAGWLAEAGWPVRAIDFAAQAVAAAKAQLGAHAGVVEQADFFTYRPPFGIERAELDALLTPHFELIEDLPVTDSLPVFEGHERWLTWRRR